MLSVVIPTWYFATHEFSWLWMAASLVYFKLIQKIGGGGEHLLVVHGLARITGLNKILIPISWLMCGLTRLSFFAKYHIIHHYYVDTDKDPHSPLYFNKWYLIFGLWALDAHKYDQYVGNNVKMLTSFGRSASVIKNNILFHITDKYYYTILFAIIGVTSYFNITLAVYGVLLPMLLNIVDGNLFFVYLLHKDGKARDIRWVNYWFFNTGSGLHRVHHRGL
jgi:fatty-acid desaturase